MAHREANQNPKNKKMSEEAKRNVQGNMTVKTNPDDRKPSAAAANSGAASGKRVVIKSADMFSDMQKEAVDIAIAVKPLNLAIRFCFFSFLGFRCSIDLVILFSRRLRSTALRRMSLRV